MQAGRREGLLTGTAFAAAILALFWLALVAGLREKNLGFDEVLHAIAGYSYWRFDDYGLQPENGNLPQRLAGLPLVLGSYAPPVTDSADWRNSQAPVVGYAWLYEQGNDADRMGASARAACGALAVALGAVVWAWSRRLFGPTGGMISLLLYVLNPTILANGALITSDMAAALFLLAASWAWWSVLHRLSTGRLLGSSLLSGALFVSKASAVLLGPIMLVLVAARLWDGRPLPAVFGRWRGEIGSRTRQAAAFAAAGAVHVAVVFAVIWTFYGFRYSAFPPASGDRFVAPWEYVLNKADAGTDLRELDLSPDQSSRAAEIFQAHGVTKPLWTYEIIAALDEIRGTVLTADQSRRLDAIRGRPPAQALFRAIDFFRRHELLPEAWLYGFANVVRQSQARREFWNGEFSEKGWVGFFPYTFLVKTPLALFGVAALALGAGLRSRRQGRGTLPLWILFGVYWLVAVSSHLNIGHRHLLPVYPPLFILCGASAYWLGPGASRWAGAALCGLLVILAAETLWFFPNYLAYFNGLIRPADAYRHLVDSSLDWGQELPAARGYIDRHPEGRPYYLSYFGEGSPAYYKVDARPLYSFGGPYLRGVPDFLMVKVPADRVDETVARLQREKTHYDLMGVGQGGDDIYAVFLKKAEELRLTAGTYLISATMLQPVYYDEAPGPWNPRYEAVYRQLQREVQPLFSGDPAARAEAFKQFDFDSLAPLLDRFEQYRLARLTDYLRRREPDDTINDGILVYHLTDADLARALDPPAN